MVEVVQLRSVQMQHHGHAEGAAGHDDGSLAKQAQPLGHVHMHAGQPAADLAARDAGQGGCEDPEGVQALAPPRVSRGLSSAASTEAMAEEDACAWIR
jgi:hypothetical protein